MGTWLRVREQIHSNYLGQHIENGSVDVMRMIKQLADDFAGHGAATASAGAVGTLAARVQREPTCSLTLTVFGCASGWRWRRCSLWR